MCESVAQLNLNEAENNFVKCYIYKPNILFFFFPQRYASPKDFH